ncbi:MAG: histidinol dehydrogenase [Robiginitomaculum sp.]|nr:MAG: histidinol dehydrogenase [Robiginitomaculum sp.]
MEIIYWNELDEGAQSAALARPDISACAVRDVVRDIIMAVKERGDEALLELTRRFDGAVAEDMRVCVKDLEAAWSDLGCETRAAMQRAFGNIARFHQAQAPAPLCVEIEDGLICERLIRPLDCVGIYVPGGTAPLFSSLLMAAIPAKLAGVRRIVVASPPGKDGLIAPVILAAAKLCGIEEIYAMGGAQAIAAMAFGTGSVPRVDKLFGPGNQWVSEAKVQVAQMQGGPAMDMPAGPSEVMVLADESANANWVAADLLSQAEHDPKAQVIMLTTAKTVAEAVKTATCKQLQSLPRASIAKKALENARLICVKDRVQMLDIVNRYAPEHLILQVQNAQELVPGVRNAGSVFVGPYTPEALGDYASGTNHVLPTAGAARAYSGLGLESFVKFITVQRATKAALASLGPVVQTLARMEELDAHARAIAVRLDAPVP